MISSAEWLQHNTQIVWKYSHAWKGMRDGLTTNITKDTELRVMIGKALPTQELEGVEWRQSFQNKQTKK